MPTESWRRVMEGDRRKLAGQSEVALLAEMPPLLEVKARPTYMQDRIRLAGMMLGGNVDFEFILRQIDNMDFVNRLGALYVIGKIKEIPAGNRQQLAERMGTLAKDGDADVRETAANALGNVGEEALPTLETLAEDREWRVRRATANALGNVGEKALPTLETLAEDEEWPVRCVAADALGNVGEKALPTLETLAKDRDATVRKAAADALGRMADRKLIFDYLVGLEEPALASPFRNETEGRLRALADISDELQREYGSRYVGLIAVGSTEKGYMNPASDLDYAVIAETPEVNRDFRKLAKERGLNPCKEHYLQPNEQSKDGKNFLFRGLFYGNRQKLNEMRKAVVESTTSEGWDKLRKEIIIENTNLQKLARYGLTPEEIEFLKQIRAILYTPPDQYTMNQLLAGQGHN